MRVAIRASVKETQSGVPAPLQLQIQIVEVARPGFNDFTDRISLRKRRSRVGDLRKLQLFLQCNESRTGTKAVKLWFHLQEH